MNTFSISKRTVYYDIEKINGWLHFQGLPRVEYARKAGFLLPHATREKLSDRISNMPSTQYYLSREERQAWLGLHLMGRSSPMYLHHIEELLNVSRGTAHAELKGLGERLKRYGLKIAFERKRGYFVHGNEKNIRAVLSNFLLELKPPARSDSFRAQPEGRLQTGLFQASALALEADQLHAVNDIIATGERMIGMELSEDTINHLASRLVLYAGRLLQGHSIELDPEEKSALQQLPQYQAAVEIARRLGHLTGAQFPEDEICYITIQLLTGKINKLEAEPDNRESRRIRAAVQYMIDSFEQQGCLYFECRAELEKTLLLHVKSMYYRAKYGIVADNPLASTVMEKYQEVFDLTAQSAAPLSELLGRSLTDHEISYLTMHFGGWIRSQKIRMSPRKTAVVVCVNGISASRLLKVQLEKLLPAVDLVAVLSLRQYEVYEQSVDFIFSTVPLARSETPVFIVPAVLSDADKVHLLNQLSPHLSGEAEPPGGPSAQAIVDLVGKHVPIPDKAVLLEEIQRYLTAARSKAPPDFKPTLAELLPASRIQLADSIGEWRQAIRQAAVPLIEEGCIRETYVQAMIRNVEHYGPYIVTAPGTAIAHAKPEDGVNRHGMALLSIREGVPFSSEPRDRVHALFIVVSEDGESHLKALSQLTLLLGDNNHRMMIGQANSKTDILTIVRQFSE